MTMKIEAGKFYRTRDGQKVGPMALPKPDDVYRWNTIGHRWGRYRDDGEDGNATGGTFQAGGDLVAEWADAPGLTALTTPFGLLDRDTQEALKAHGGPWERYSDKGKWEPSDHPCWYPGNAYRVKTAPPKPREWWLRLDSTGNICGTDPVDGDPPPNWNMAAVIKVREVLPE